MLRVPATKAWHKENPAKAGFSVFSSGFRSPDSPRPSPRKPIGLKVGHSAITARLPRIDPQEVVDTGFFGVDADASGSKAGSDRKIV